MHAELPPRAILEVEQYVEAFEKANVPPRSKHLEAYLPSPGHTLRMRVLVELLRIDLERAWAEGHSPRVEDYLEDHPELASRPDLFEALAFEEFRQRHLYGSTPTLEEYHGRLGIDTSTWPLRLCESRSTHAGSVVSRPRGFEELSRTRKVPGGADPAVLSSAPTLSRAFHFPRASEEFAGFHLVRELGRGSFGRVFLAQQAHLADRPVVLKVSSEHDAEPRTLARLQHTYIVPIYSIHYQGPFQILCMPYLGSTTFADLLSVFRQRRGRPASGREIVETVRSRCASTDGDSARRDEATPSVAGDRPALDPLAHLQRRTFVEAVLWLGARLAEGLAHAHERGILHRDLKPANVLLTEDGEPMLLDFNLAQDLHRAQADESAMGGTLAYMSPEQLEAYTGNPRALDARSDLYSLGIILYELLTGMFPFQNPGSGSLHEMVGALREGRRASTARLRNVNPDVTPAVEAIVLTCLHPDPACRYPSARALAEDLDRQLAHLPLRHIHEPSLTERLGKWVRRHPKLTSLPALAACAAAVGLALTAGGVARSLAAHRRHLDEMRVQAVERYAAFQPRMRHASHLLSNDQRDLIVEGEQQGLVLLEEYGSLDNPHWQEQPLVAHLPPEDRRRLRGDLGELAFLLARARIFEKMSDPPDERTHELNRVASSLLGDEAAAAWSLQQRDLSGQGSEANGGAPVPGRVGMLLACEHTARGRYRQALGVLDHLVREQPDEFGAWYLKARCHEALHETDEALAGYGTCITLRPSFARAYAGRAALAYGQKRDLRQAKADLDQASRLEPGLISVAIDRALVLEALGRPREALRDLDSVLQRPEAPTRVWFIRAKVRDRLGDRAGADRDRTEGLARTPSEVLSWIARGVARLPKDPAGALDDFRQAEKHDPRCAEARINQAFVLAEIQKKPADAVVVLDRLLTFLPDHLHARAGRAVLLARLGRGAEALEEARRCLASSARPDNQYRAACILALVGKDDPASRRESKRWLATALLAGWGSDHVTTDTDLDPLLSDAEFRGVREAFLTLQKWKGPK